MSDRLWVATRKGLFEWQRGPGGWSNTSRHFLGTPVGLVHHDPKDGALYASLDHGHFGCKLQRSRDGGASWEECAVPSYPEKPEGLEDLDPFRRTPREWKLSKAWSLATGAADPAGRLWCGTIPGGLFRSDDHGSSWHFVRSLWDVPERAQWFGGGEDHPGIHSVCVHPEDPQDLVVGVSCGGVWRSRDGGDSWALRAEGMRAAYMPGEQANNPAIQDPHCVVQCPSSPQHLWSQHHNGIFRSTDRAESWTECAEVQPSSFGFATAVHPSDPDTAWFVPALKDEERIPVDGKVVVTRTRDGGRSFEVLRDGLPQDNAWDLVFRHALDVDGGGQGLAFGSTTGSLWVSGDGGQSFASLSQHLPPVYCVRFA